MVVVVLCLSFSPPPSTADNTKRLYGPSPSTGALWRRTTYCTVRRKRGLQYTRSRQIFVSFAFRLFIIRPHQTAAVSKSVRVEFSPLNFVELILLCCGRHKTLVIVQYVLRRRHNKRLQCPLGAGLRSRSSWPHSVNLLTITMTTTTMTTKTPVSSCPRVCVCI